MAVLLLGAATILASCRAEEEGYQEQRGQIAVEDLSWDYGADGDDVDAEALLAQGRELEEAGRTADALTYYARLALDYPRLILAIEARRRRINLLVGAEQLELAHIELVELINYYKEFLQQTRNQDIWANIRAVWYRDIGLGLMLDEDGTLGDELDKAEIVFETLFTLEPRGPFAALCLLRRGDIAMAKGDRNRARLRYLRIVDEYPDFQEYDEHEEALYKAARATLSQMKGEAYDRGAITSQGSGITEKGALDLVNDYGKEYGTGGVFAEEVRRLRDYISGLLAKRDFEAAEVYDSLDEEVSAATQYWYVVQTWTDETRLTRDGLRQTEEVNRYVARAAEKLREKIEHLPAYLREQLPADIAREIQ